MIDSETPSGEIWRKVADLPPYLRHACVECGLRHDQEIKIGVAVQLTYHADANRRSRAAGIPLECACWFPFLDTAWEPGEAWPNGWRG